MKVYDKFTARYIKNYVYGRNCYIPPKKVYNEMLFPFANKTIKLKNHNGDMVATIIVDYWDYREYYNILKHLQIVCATINVNNVKECRDVLLAYIRRTIINIRNVISKIIDWCDFYVFYSETFARVCIDHYGIKCLIYLKPNEQKFFEYMKTCYLKDLSNRPLVDSLIGYLTNYAERLGYYEQEIAKSKN